MYLWLELGVPFQYLLILANYAKKQFITLMEDPDKILEWVATWQMMSNIEKCKVMQFCAKNLQAKYYLGDVTLGESAMEKRFWGSSNMM